MTLKEYLAEVKERADNSQKDTFLARSACRTDIPRLIAIVEAQAEALGKLAKERSSPIFPGMVEAAHYYSQLVFSYERKAKEALAKAEAIAGGEA